MSSTDSFEWFEIVEPRTKRHVFINSLSGKSQWNKPEKYQQLTDNQWWELFDFKTNHFYYYNSQTNSKTWVKPNTIYIVSLVKLQILKEKKNKTFTDASIQTSFEDLFVGDEEPVISKDLNRSDMSLDNIETSGYSTYKSNNIHIDSLKAISTKSDSRDHPDLSSTLPASRKPIPRTNPNYTRHSTAARLSQPVISLYGDPGIDIIGYSTSIGATDSLKNGSFGSLNQTMCSSSMSIDESNISKLRSSQSIIKVPVETFENNNFPRDSIINAIEGKVPSNNEIWSASLFNKSGSQLAGIKTWTTKSIPDSLLASTPKAYKKKATENFKQIQMYMEDRKGRISKELLALTICRRGISSTAWSNEIFMQICKQVTYNPNKKRTFYGWELVCICLMFFHPESAEMKRCFKIFLEQYSCPNTKLNMFAGDVFDSKSIFCARVSLKLLDMSHKATEISAQDIFEAKKSYASPTIFYSSLNEVMDMQKRFYPDLKLPWIQVALTKEIMRCNGAQTQGILRIPSEIFKIDSLCDAIEKSFKPEAVPEIDVSPRSDGCDPLLNKILDDLKFEHDPLLLSSVLKYWLRHLRQPIISFGDGDDSLSVISRDYTKLMKKVNSLPAINLLVLKYLIYFLQELARPENVVFTNMPVENLVTLMAPTLFKLDFNQLQSAMNMLQSLIVNLDTSDIANIS